MESDKSKRQTDSIKHQSLFFFHVLQPPPPSQKKWQIPKVTKTRWHHFEKKLRAVTRPSLNFHFRFSDKPCWHRRSWSYTGLCGNWNRFFLITLSNLLSSHKLLPCAQNVPTWLFTELSSHYRRELFFSPHVGRTRRQISTPPGNFTL